MKSTLKKPPEITNRARVMRHCPTPAEKTLWAVLRNRQIEGCKFVRQYPIAPYIVDFCCREKKLVVEVDGAVHIRQQADDRARDQDLAELGYRVIRFTNDDVLKNINAVVKIIKEALNA
jgi:very-short-patch-repair endonuclease